MSVGSTEPFAAGETVVVQERWRGFLWAARPMRVVADDGDLAILWSPAGPTWKRPVPPGGRHVGEGRADGLATSLLRCDWVLLDTPWHTHTLQFWRRGAWHSTWISWLPSGEHWGWYLNLQRPLERWELGFRTMDLALDVIVEPDFSWRLKDEDELEVFERRGAFDAALVARTRQAAREAIDEAAARRPPFDGGWAAWRPDPGWRAPELPSGWDSCR